MNNLIKVELAWREINKKNRNEFIITKKAMTDYFNNNTKEIDLYELYGGDCKGHNKIGTVKHVDIENRIAEISTDLPLDYFIGKEIGFAFKVESGREDGIYDKIDDVTYASIVLANLSAYSENLQSVSLRCTWNSGEYLEDFHIAKEVFEKAFDEFLHKCAADDSGFLGLIFNNKYAKTNEVIGAVKDIQFDESKNGFYAECEIAEGVDIESLKEHFVLGFDYMTYGYDLQGVFKVGVINIDNTHLVHKSLNRFGYKLLGGK